MPIWYNHLQLFFLHVPKPSQRSRRRLFPLFCHAHQDFVLLTKCWWQYSCLDQVHMIDQIDRHCAEHSVVSSSRPAAAVAAVQMVWHSLPPTGSTCGSICLPWLAMSTLPGIWQGGSRILNILCWWFSCRLLEFLCVDAGVSRKCWHGSMKPELLIIVWMLNCTMKRMTVGKEMQCTRTMSNSINDWMLATSTSKRWGSCMRNSLYPQLQCLVFSRIHRIYRYSTCQTEYVAEWWTGGGLKLRHLSSKINLASCCERNASLLSSICSMVFRLS